MTKTTKQLHEERVKMWDASISNHAKYIDSETGLVALDYVENRCCPVCKEVDKDIFLFNKEGGTYVKCEKCKMVYVNPVFKDDALTEYYKGNHTVQSEIVATDPDGFYERLYNQGLDAALRANSGISSALDIGCSSGMFLNLAKQKGLNTYGVELNTKEFAYAQSMGHEVYNDLLENISFGRTFDLITMWDVFEHLKDGRFYLEAMKSLLSEEGVIFLQVPSSDSLAAKIMREKCNMFDGIEHVNLYGVATLTQLVESCGLNVLSLETVIPEIGVINNYLDYDDPYLGSSTNKDVILSLINTDTILTENLGYKIQIVIGK